MDSFKEASANIMTASGLVDPSGNPLKGLELAVARIQLTEEAVHYHGNGIAKIVFDISQNLQYRDGPRLQRMEDKMSTIKDTVDNIVELIQAMNNEIHERPVSPAQPTSGAAEAVDAAMAGMMPFLTVMVDGYPQPSTLFLSRQDHDSLLISPKPREMLRKLLLILHPVRELHTFKFSDYVSPRRGSDKQQQKEQESMEVDLLSPPEESNQNGKKKPAPLVAIPAKTYEYCKAAMFKLFPADVALDSISTEKARFEENTKKTMRELLGKVLQYFRRFYTADGIKIKPAKPEAISSSTKRKMDYGENISARQNGLKKRPALFQGPGGDSNNVVSPVVD